MNSGYFPKGSSCSLIVSLNFVSCSKLLGCGILKGFLLFIIYWAWVPIPYSFTCTKHDIFMTNRSKHFRWHFLFDCFSLSWFNNLFPLIRIRNIFMIFEHFFLYFEYWISCHFSLFSNDLPSWAMNRFQLLYWILIHKFVARSCSQLKKDTMLIAHLMVWIIINEIWL